MNFDFIARFALNERRKWKALCYAQSEERPEFPWTPPWYPQWSKTDRRRKWAGVRPERRKQKKGVERTSVADVRHWHWRQSPSQGFCLIVCHWGHPRSDCYPPGPSLSLSPIPLLLDRQHWGALNIAPPRGPRDPAHFPFVLRIHTTVFSTLGFPLPKLLCCR